MSYIALNTAATGMSACTIGLDVTANNIANANTTGFKASRANFEDLFYQELAQPGLPAGNAVQRPTGLYVGLGTQVSGTQLNFEQGPAQAASGVQANRGRRDQDLTSLRAAGRARRSRAAPGCAAHPARE